MQTISSMRNTVLSAFEQMGASKDQINDEIIKCQNLAYILDWYDAIDQQYSKTPKYLADENC